MNPTTQPICQSCGMPMNPDQYGKNQDGSPNAEYCIYCYPNGAFSTAETMEEMIEDCIPHMVGGEFIADCIAFVRDHDEFMLEEVKKGYGEEDNKCK
jgi:hypothetical protein